MPIDPKLRDRIAETAHQRALLKAQMDEQLDAVVMEARQAGALWPEVAAILGVSKQAVTKRWGGKQETVPNKDQGPFFKDFGR